MSKPRVFVTRQIPEEGLALVRQACRADVWPQELPPSRQVILDKVAACDGLLCLLTDPIDAEVIRAGERLKVISQFAVGVDNIDVAAATARGIPIGHTPDVLTEATADFAFTLLAAAARRVVEGVDFVRAGRWRTWGPTLLLGADLWGSTLGIVGLGRIGRALARRAGGFQMRVLYYDNRACVGEIDEETGAICQPLEAVLAESDFVSLHVPLTDETHHLIDRQALSLMKPTAVLVNTARGPVVDPVALCQALRDGTIAAAALDVTEPEPIPLDDPLLSLPNCLVVPHIASATRSSRARMARMAADNLLAGLRGERLPYPFNPQVYEDESGTA